LPFEAQGTPQGRDSPGIGRQAKACGTFKLGEHLGGCLVADGLVRSYVVVHEHGLVYEAFDLVERFTLAVEEPPVLQGRENARNQKDNRNWAMSSAIYSSFHPAVFLFRPIGGFRPFLFNSAKTILVNVE